MNANGGVEKFCTWVETWETKKIGTNCDAIFEARFLSKYGSLKWLEPDNKFSLRVAHTNRMHFNKQRGKKLQYIFNNREIWPQHPTRESSRFLLCLVEQHWLFSNKWLTKTKTIMEWSAMKKGGLWKWRRITS